MRIQSHKETKINDRKTRSRWCYSPIVHSIFLTRACSLLAQVAKACFFFVEKLIFISRFVTLKPLELRISFSFVHPSFLFLCGMFWVLPAC